jgi:hypothetical protein
MDTSFLGLAKEAAEGWYGMQFNLWYSDADNAGIKLVTQAHTDNKRTPAEKSLGYLLTWSVVDAAKQIYEKTIDRVGFDALSGEEVFKTMTTMGEIKTLDGVMIMGPYDKDVRAGRKARMVQVQGGTFKPVSDWMSAPNLAPGAK